MNKFSFFDLRVYQESKALVKEVYKLLQKFPKYEVYALGDQLRRSVISVPSNIAEGSARTDKDFAHFLSIAIGSLFELSTQIILAERIGYIDHTQSLSLCDKADKLQMMISGFMRRLEEGSSQPIVL